MAVELCATMLGCFAKKGCGKRCLPVAEENCNKKYRNCAKKTQIFLVLYVLGRPAACGHELFLV